MRTLRLPAVAVCSLLLSSAALIHCGGDDTFTGDTGNDSGASDGSSGDSTTNNNDAAPHDAGVTPPPGDASLTDYCKSNLAFSTHCGFPICDDGGVGFAVACDAYDNDINSAIQRQASETCIAAQADAACDQLGERSCEDTVFRAGTPTTAQTKLVTDYCSTCEPANGGCQAAAFSNLDGGESFIYGTVWGLSDTVLSADDTHCTGAALPLDAGTCAESFYNCQQGVLLTFPSAVSYLNCP
jgi:hypothetical protein